MKQLWIVMALWCCAMASAMAQSPSPLPTPGLTLPGEWSVTPLMAPTTTMGLRVSTYAIDEPEDKILQWRQQHMAACRLPAASDEDDWHCLGQRYIYSLLWREGGFIWVHSERLVAPANEGELRALPASLAGLDAEVLSYSETAFESVTLLHSRRSLYGLQRYLLGVYEAQGARLLFQEQDSGGFIQQWQHLQDKVTYTAQKDEQGDVLLVKVRGTNL